MNIIAKKTKDYTLLLSEHPAEVFRFYNVKELHGLNLNDCVNHKNTPDDSYIAGWCNYIPKENNIYNLDDPSFVYINLTRCKNDAETMSILFHEFIHMALRKFQWNLHKEEEIISWADEESHIIFEYLKTFIFNDV